MLIGGIFGVVATILAYLGVLGICHLSKPKEEDVHQRQITIPHVLSIKQVRHMTFGDVAWTSETAVWVDGQSKVWIVNDSVISDKKPEFGNPIKISFVEKKGYCLEVSSLSKWKVGEYSTYHNKSYPVVEMKTYEHDKKK